MRDVGTSHRGDGRHLCDKHYELLFFQKRHQKHQILDPFRTYVPASGSTALLKMPAFFRTRA